MSQPESPGRIQGQVDDGVAGEQAGQQRADVLGLPTSSVCAWFTGATS
jgi:hypothetical protein